MRKLLFALILFNTSMFVNAQQTDVKSLVGNITKPYTKNKEFSVKFTATISGNKTTGTIYVSNDKYKIVTDEFQLLFDGKDRYNYMIKNNEIYVESALSDDNYALNSPQRLFQLTKNSAPELVENKDGSRSLIFNNEGLIVRIDKTNNILDVDDYKNKTKINILSSDTNTDLPESMFVFNANDYQNVEIIDFR